MKAVGGWRCEVGGKNVLASNLKPQSGSAATGKERLKVQGQRHKEKQKQQSGNKEKTGIRKQKHNKQLATNDQQATSMKKPARLGRLFFSG
jgi:hypothetical protein